MSQNVTKFSGICLIQGMSKNVTKFSGICLIQGMSQNVTECRCLIYEMPQNETKCNRCRVDVLLTKCYGMLKHKHLKVTK